MYVFEAVAGGRRREGQAGRVRRGRPDGPAARAAEPGPAARDRRRTCAPRVATARWSAPWTRSAATGPASPQPWERQALLRARPVAGDAELGARFVAAADRFRYPESGLSQKDVVEIRRIKARVDTERMPRGADVTTHTKLGRGGLADVEWTVQLLQLQHAHELPGLRTTATLAAIEAARARSACSTTTTRPRWSTAGSRPRAPATRSCWSAASRTTRSRATAANWTPSRARWATRPAATPASSSTTTAGPPGGPGGSWIGVFDGG